LLLSYSLKILFEESLKMRIKSLLPACVLVPLSAAPASTLALTVEIQGVRLTPPISGASCVEIAGDYPSVAIVTNDPGKTPRICFNSSRINSITILNATLLAKDPAKKDISLKFEHEFPTGINGKIMARVKLNGFFSSSKGVGVPTGDKLSLNAFFSQGDSDDAIADPLDMTVGEDIESALFEYSVKEQYLIVGRRTLKGAMKILFAKPGESLTLQDKCSISLDTGARMEDKLETMQPGEGEETPPESPGGPTPDEGAAPIPGTAPAPESIPFPEIPGAPGKRETYPIPN
jgi:hypothetical protein